MVITSAKKILELEKSCNRLQRKKHVRFIGVLNKMGNLIAGGFSRGISPYVDHEKEHVMYMQLILELKMRNEFDDSLGKVQYLHSRREKVNMFSIPIGKHLVVVSTEINVNHNEIVNMVNKEFIELKIAEKNLSLNTEHISTNFLQNHTKINKSN